MPNSKVTVDAPAIRFSGFEGAWERKRLGELAKSFEYGLNAPAIPFDGRHTYIRITDIKDATRTLLSDGLTSPGADLSFCSDYLVQQGDVLFARTGASTGKTYLVRGHEGAAYFAGFLIRMRALDSASSSFVYYSTFTKAYSKFISIASQRSGQPGVNAGQYSNWSLKVPSLPEQRAIGSLFSALDSLIEAEGAKLAALRATRESMLARMFPREGEDVPEVRFARFEGAWERRRLGEVAQRITIPSDDPNLPRIEFEDLVAEQGSLKKRIGDLGHEKPGIEFRKGDVLYGKLRPYLHNWLNPSFDGIAVGDFWVLRPERNDGGFLYRLVQSRRFDALANISSGSKMPRADWGLLSSSSFCVPISLPEQRAIGSFFSRLDALIEAQEKRVETLGRARRGLLARMFC